MNRSNSIQEPEADGNLKQDSIEHEWHYWI